MSGRSALHDTLDASARRWPDRVAVENPDGGTIAYRDLAALSDRLRDRLVRLGVSPGDRVGIYLTKSIDAVAAILGTLKAGAAYVPVDPHGPPPRNGYILSDCGCSVIVAEVRFEAALREHLGDASPRILRLESTGDGSGLDQALRREESASPAPPVASVASAADDLAYILYTSGSTGRPKGVMLSHGNATSYVAWCSATFTPTENDRFSSHAPFHFDLSILDVYVPLAHGATLVLVGHELGKDPARLARAIAEQRLSVWYSTPSILSLLCEYGDLPSHDLSSLRLILFAGEVFPVKHLRALLERLPRPRYFNLYGPTETNVCTFYEIPREIPAARTEPYPIGATCDHLRSRVIDEQGRDVARGEEGELVIAGPAVTGGYWNLPEQTAGAFVSGESGAPWYRTGDLVLEDADGNYVFRGRRDRMVKKRGFRVELDEIEACLYACPDVRQAAVVALTDEDGVTIKAFVAAKGAERLSIIALKKFCRERIPAYMVPDRFSFQGSLPTTSTDKIDYQELRKLE